MKRVFTLEQVRGYQSFILTGWVFDLWQEAGPVALNRRPSRVEINHPKLPLADLCGFDRSPLVFSPRAHDVLADHLDATCQLIPMNVRRKPFWIVHVTNLIDCLDRKKSGWDQQTYRYEKLDFSSRKLGKWDVFRIEESEDLYFRETFKQAVEDAGLVGFEFVEVWNEKEGAIDPQKARKKNTTSKTKPKAAVKATAKKTTKTKASRKKTKKPKYDEGLSRDDFLHYLWTEIIDEGRSGSWVTTLIKEIKKNQDVPFADGYLALDRMVKAGAKKEDIGEIRRMIAYEVVFSFLYALGDPGLANFEDLECLYEGLLSADPSGCEGRPA